MRYNERSYGVGFLRILNTKLNTEMTQEQEIKGILVHFFREGNKGDYLDALNSAIKEIQQVKNCSITVVSGSLPSLNKIKLKRVDGSTHCKYSVIEQKLAILYENQKKILQAIKLLGNER